MTEDNSHLRAGKASDLQNTRDRIIFRLFEILPGVFSFGTLFLLAFLSWFRPAWVAYFIIVFATYWLIKSIYYIFYLRAGYKKMRENEKIDWIEKLNQLNLDNHVLGIKDWRELYHLVVFPMYKEPLEIVKDTFDVLSEKNDYPKDKLIVVLACEEKARKDMEATAQEIERRSKGKFFKFLVTWHPNNLPGEIAGKGSNETWAAKKAKEEIIDPLGIPHKNVIFSALDVDTMVAPKYFSCLSYYYLTVKKPTQTSYQPIPLFINNIWDASIFSCIFGFSSTYWQMMCQERPEKLITFSSHSMSFEALVKIGFKQTNVVSDDSRIFWNCFFAYDGDYRTQPLYYPISMDATAAKTLPKTLINIYKQQRRWAYGVGEIPYFVLAAIKNKKIPFSKKLSLGFVLWEGHWSWATNSIILFLFGWLPLVLGGAKFSQTLISYTLPQTTSKILTIAMVGLLSSIYFSMILLPPRPKTCSRSRYVLIAFAWLVTPIVLIFFTSFPALDAQARWMFGKYMGFWPTEKVRK